MASMQAMKRSGRVEWWMRRALSFLMFVFVVAAAPRAFAQSAALSVAFSATPERVQPGETIVYKIVLSNPSTTTPTPALSLRFNTPQYVGVTYVPDGQCNTSCRFGGFVSFNVASLDPGETTMVQLTAVVDNSTTNPPPSDGTVISAQLLTTIGTTTLSNSTDVTVGPHPLHLAITGTPERAAPGSDVTYTLSYGNAGNSGVPVKLSLPVPAGASFVAAEGGGVLSGSRVEWTLGSLAAGFSDRRRVTLRIDGSAAAGSLVVVRPELLHADSAALLARESIPTLVHPDALLSMHLTATPNPVGPGDTLVYKLRLANRSTNTPTSSFWLRVNIPRNLVVTYVPDGQCNSSCRFGGLLSFSIASLDPGESTEVQFTAVIDNSTTNPPPPTGSVLFAEAFAYVFGGVVAREAVFVGDGSKLSLALSGAPARAEPGADVTYSVGFGNAGTSAVSALLSVSIPSGMSFVAATGGGTASGGKVRWDLGSIAAGFTDRRRVTLRVDAGAVPGTVLTSSAELLQTTSERLLVRESKTTLVANSDLLSMSLTASPGPHAPGNTVVYTLRLSNKSTNTPTSSFWLRVNIPKFMAVTYVPDGQCNSSCRFGGLLSFSMASLDPGESTVVQFTAVLDNSTGNPPPPNGSVLSASATAYVLGGVTAEETLFVNDGSRLNVALSGVPARAAAGSDVLYTLSYGNVGSAGTPALLGFALPPGTSFVSATGGGTQNGGRVEWNLGTVAAGFSDRQTVTLRVDEGAPDGTLLIAKAALDNPSTLRPLVEDTAATLVAPTTLLAMTLHASPNPVRPGDSVVYTLRLANRSTNTPTGSFWLRVNIPKFMAVTYVPDGQCNSSCRFGGLLSFSVASLDPGEGTEVQFTAVVDNSTANPPPPTGSVLSADAHAYVFGGVSAKEVVLVGTGSNLDLALRGTPDRVAPGAQLTYTLNFGNTGASAVAAYLSLPVPTGTSFVSATGDGVASGGSVEWDLGSVGAGSTDERQVTMRVDDAAVDGTLVVAAAELRMSSGRTLVRRKTANLVASQSLLGMTMSATPDPVLPGNSLVYTVNISNGSTNTATGSFWVRANPPQFASVTAVPGGQCNSSCRYGGLLSWSVPSLAPGGNTVLQFTAAVDNSTSNPPPPNGTVLDSSVTAYVFGSVRADSLVRVGTIGPGGSGGSGAGGSSGAAGSAGSAGLSAGGTTSSSGGSAGAGTAGTSSSSGGSAGLGSGGTSAGSSGAGGSGGSGVGAGGEGGESGESGAGGQESEGGAAGELGAGGDDSPTDGGAAGEKASGEAGASGSSESGGAAGEDATGAGESGTAHGGSGGTGGRTAGAGGRTSGGSSGAAGTPAGDKPESSGCDCSMGRSESTDTARLSLVVLLGLGFAARRRRRAELTHRKAA